MDKEFRQKIMLGTPFLVIWLVGFIADLDIDSWLLKGLMYCGVWVTVQFLSKSFFDHSMHSALPLGIYLATKFWMYVTWFYWFWIDILYNKSLLVSSAFSPSNHDTSVSCCAVQGPFVHSATWQDSCVCVNIHLLTINSFIKEGGDFWELMGFD
eukprot:XP_014009330.1 PREDICTED: palmitoyltransferase ZDHHC17-like [Salmo salar]